MGEEYRRQVVVLGSVPALGPVALYDNLEGTFKWIAGGTAGDGVVERLAGAAFNDSYGLHCKSRVTSAAAGDTVFGLRYFPPRSSLKYRLDALFELVDSTKFSFLDFLIYLDDGVNFWKAGLYYDAFNNLWKYFNSAGGWSEISGGAQTLITAAWNRIELELDTRTGKYVSMACNGLVVDLTALSMQTGATSGAAQGWVSIDGATVGAAACEFYVDDVLILEA